MASRQRPIVTAPSEVRDSEMLKSVKNIAGKPVSFVQSMNQGRISINERGLALAKKPERSSFDRVEEWEKVGMGKDEKTKRRTSTNLCM